MKNAVETTSYWTDTTRMPRFGAIDRDLEVDSVVVGAGITGLTAAYLLKRSGRRVAVLERRRVGGVDTMATTAHVTCVTDLSLGELVRNFGRDHAQAVWDAGLAAIAQIDSIVRGERIDCSWTFVDGVKHAAPGHTSGQVKRLQEEATLANELGFEARYVDSTPFVAVPGIVFGSQARLHPAKYLAALATLVDGDGSFVFEESACDEVVDEPLSVKAGGHTVSCQYVVLATHTPLIGKTNLASATLLQTKLYLYTSYVIGGRVPKGTVPDLLFWDTADPYHYLRIDTTRDHDFAFFGGNDHKTGQVSDEQKCVDQLEAAAKALIPGLDVTHHWSGQVITTNDGLPFIGETSSRQFAGTGFAGNGTTFGTLTGMMAADAALGLKNPWSELFNVGRTKIRGGAWDYIKENVDYPYYLLRDRVAGPDATSLRELRRGEGKIIELRGERVAASRGEDGRVTTLSAICTHMGCQVEWNTAERTWDCPCHGSRFTATGEVLAGPAESPLEKK
jgi:glycine/D-amino acid oxidase-like deaminating enzyme/nitrite reductase/ring-hydroxylating ferredoxin subunit